MHSPEWSSGGFREPLAVRPRARLAFPSCLPTLFSELFSECETPGRLRVTAHGLQSHNHYLAGVPFSIFLMAS